MAENKITFTECELVVNESQIPQLNIFNNKQRDIYDVDGISYIVDCEIVDEKFFWIYARYGKAKPYANEVLNTETQEIAQNKREPNEAELRNQLFCMYVPSKAILYMSDFRKNIFLATYLKAKFNQEFIIKKYFIEPKEFVNKITSVQSLKFVGVDENIFNSSIFEEVRDVLGYGQPISFTLETKVRDYKFDPKKCLDFLLLCKNKKENQQIDKMICIGKDDNGFEKIFNLDTYLKRIKLSVIKDESEMYNPQIIKNALLEQLNA
ncbi:hypothetical protein [Helicobacter typhlonius]|uniref:hypothetical protein n=1 Tax=Helicobacter typhlonius TaxID=76936 RepID=UPI002FE37DA7